MNRNQSIAAVLALVLSLGTSYCLAQSTSYNVGSVVLNDGTGHTTTLSASNTSTQSFSFPSSQGSNGDFLSTDGTGATVWSNVTSTCLSLQGGTMTGALDMGSNSISSTGTISANSFTGSLTGNVTGHASDDLSSSGGTLSGSLDMGSNSLTSSGTISAGTFSGSLTGHASSDLPLAGGTMSGSIDMGSNNISAIGALTATGLTTLAATTITGAVNLNASGGALTSIGSATGVVNVLSNTWSMNAGQLSLGASGSMGKIAFSDGATTNLGTIQPIGFTNARTFSLPDKSGTFAMTTDITSGAVGGDLSGTVGNALIASGAGADIITAINATASGHNISNTNITASLNGVTANYYLAPSATAATGSSAVAITNVPVFIITGSGANTNFTLPTATFTGEIITIINEDHANTLTATNTNDANRSISPDQSGVFYWDGSHWH